MREHLCRAANWFAAADRQIEEDQRKITPSTGELEAHVERHLMPVSPTDVGEILDHPVRPGSP